MMDARAFWGGGKKKAEWVGLWGGGGGIRVYSKLSYRQSQKGRSGGSGELVQSWQIATSLRPIARDIKNGAVVGN